MSPTFNIAAANEDGNSTGTDEYINPADGPFGAAYLGDFSSELKDWAGIYRGTGIPQGATITAASISMPLQGGDVMGTSDGAWWGFNVDSPTDFNAADAHRISDHHARTTATVTDNFTATPDPHISPSLITILQEIVDRAGFSGDVGLTWRSSSDGAGSEWFSTGSFETGNAASLTVEWTGGAGGAVTSPFYYMRRRKAA